MAGRAPSYALTEADKAYLRKLAAMAPPLTPEQRRRLRPILAGTLAPVLALREPQAA